MRARNYANWKYIYLEKCKLEKRKFGKCKFGKIEKRKIENRGEKEILKIGHQEKLYLGKLEIGEIANL